MNQGGPVFYRQQRRGLRGREFTMIKFRTLSPHAECNGGRTSATLFVPSHLCRFLRSTHLDELPQCWNIFRGDMHIVGPRPLTCAMSDECCEKISGFEERYSVKPGLTGIAQLLQGITTTIHDDEVRLKYDMYYIHHRNARMLMRILVATVAHCMLQYRISQWLLRHIEHEVNRSRIRMK